MESAILLNKLTTKQKLQLMEEIWNDLLGNEDAIPSPVWYNEIFQTRMAQVREGSSAFTDGKLHARSSGMNLNEHRDSGCREGRHQYGIPVLPIVLIASNDFRRPCFRIKMSS